MFSKKLTPHAAQKKKNSWLKSLAQYTGSAGVRACRYTPRLQTNAPTQLLQDLIGKSGAFAGAANGKERVIKATELENTLFFSTFAPKTN